MSMTAKMGHGSPFPYTHSYTYHRIKELHEEAVSLVLGHPDLGLDLVEELPSGAVLQEDELPVARLVGPRAVASHDVVVPVGQTSHY